MKFAYVPILSVLGQPIYMMEACIKWVQVPISPVSCYNLSIVETGLKSYLKSYENRKLAEVPSCVLMKMSLTFLTFF